MGICGRWTGALDSLGGRTPEVVGVGGVVFWVFQIGGHSLPNPRHFQVTHSSFASESLWHPGHLAKRQAVPQAVQMNRLAPCDTSWGALHAGHGPRRDGLIRWFRLEGRGLRCSGSVWAN